MLAGAIEVDAQGLTFFVRSLWPEFRLENRIHQRGDCHDEEFEEYHRVFLSNGGLLQPDMCVVLCSPVPPAGASDVVA